MSRLIDADNLKIPNDAPYKASVKRVVAQQPTVEARPVVHGEWEEKIMNYFCSQCKTAFDDDLTWITGEFKLPNFCPRCGADMRGGKNGL